jgi:hypothetical protein
LGGRKLNAPEKRAKKAAALQLFAKQYARKAVPGYDPNDRSYDRDVEQMARRLSPEELDALLRDGEDDYRACLQSI